MFMTQTRLVLVAVVLCGTLAGGTALWALGAQEPQPAQAQPPVVTEPLIAPLAPAPANIAAADKAPAVVRTDNFIVDAPSRRIAHLVGDAAERLRKSEAIRWLGKELPPWSEPCTLRVHLAQNDRVHSATSFRFANSKVLGRDMTLGGTLDSVLCNGLPHEITHTILADHFRAPIPRWADEGAALQAEDSDEQQRHQALMRQYSEPSRFIALKKLFAMKDYPPQVMALYAESYSLTRFLLQRKDRKTFLAFVKQGMNSNAWDSAVKDHYGFADVDGLQKAWLATVGADVRAHAAAAAETLTAIKSAPPTIGRAAIDTNGRLVLRTPTSYYQPVTRYRHDADKNAAFPVTSYEFKVAERVAHHDLKDVTATDVAGKPIDAKTLAIRLQKETAVLIAPAGQAVDPYYLAVVREGTIILTPPVTSPVPLAPIAP